MTKFAIYLLGPPRMELNGKPVTVNTRKAVALAAYLAVTGRPHNRDALTALLWPELDRRRGRAALRTTLSALKKAMGWAGLVVERESIGLDSTYLQCDATQFAALLAARQAHDHAEDDVCPRCLALLDEAAGLYRDHFMAGFSLADSAAFDDWQRYQADSLRRQLGRVLSWLTQCYIAQDKAEAAVAQARRWAALDPLHEPVHRQLMQLYAAGGRRTAALRQYQACSRILAGELGVAPDAETTALYTQIRDAGGMAIEADTRRKSPDSPPLPATPLVGRGTELAQIRQRLADPACRLLTLVGAGGMGKTRLALEIVQGRSEWFPDGRVFVPLAPVSDAGFLVAAIAGALGFSFYGQNEPKQQLLNYLREKRLLLVLDNFEHLLPGTELLAEIGQKAPQVKLLVTSRERLLLKGEWVLAVNGLSYPEDGTAVSGNDYSAIQLFSQAARRISPDFSIEREYPAVSRICGLVDGMPLGIELAAAWTRALPCREIAQEIAGNLDFLSVNLRDLPQRHRSLRAVFDHSWDLLTEAERKAFRQLSIFRGSFDRVAATAVTGTDLALLSVLVDKSLLRRTADDRYAIPEALRPYGAEKRGQTPHEQRAIKSRHGRYFADFLQQREVRLKAGRQKEALAEISVEIENARLAWRWAVDAQDIAALDMAAESLFLFYEMGSYFQEGVAAFQAAAQALPKSAGQQWLSVRAKVLARQGRFSHRLGRHEQARELLQESLAVTRGLDAADAQAEVAFALNNLGYVAWSLSAYEEAKSYYRQSLAIYRRIDDKWGLGRALNNLAILPQELSETRRLLQESRRIAGEIGDLWGMARALNNLGLVVDDRQEARQLYQESVAICQAIGDRFLATFPLINLGHTARLVGEYAEAQQFYRESLTICREIGYQAGAARNLGHLGMAAYALGDTAAAESHCRDGLALCRTVGDRRGSGLLQYTMGLTATANGDLKAAEAHHRDSLAVFRQTDDRQGIAWPLLGLARLSFVRGEFERAQKWGRESLAIFQEVGDKDGMARAQTALGVTAVNLNEYETAEKLLEEALTTAVSLQAIPIILEALVGIAALRMRKGHDERALALLRFVQRHSGSEQITRDWAARLWAGLVERLEPEVVTAVDRNMESASLGEIVAAVWEEGLA